MRQFENNVKIVGKLVSVKLEDRITKDGTEVFSGDIVLRTSDNSEHKIGLFTNKYKKDENKNFTSEENYFYTQYKEFVSNSVDMEHCFEGQEPSVVSIMDGTFIDNDFKNKSGDVISSVKISGRFVNILEGNKAEETPQTASFSVEGIIKSIDDEIKENVPTGNLIIKFDIIAQKSNGFGNSAEYEVDKIIPISLIIDDKNIVNGFKSCGYYPGCFCKLYGNVINTTEITEKVEKAAFGADQIKTFKNTVKKFQVLGGSAAQNIYELQLTDDIVNQLKSKRNAKLNEVKNSNSNGTNGGFQPAPSSNPFGNSNPFNRQ